MRCQDKPEEELEAAWELKNALSADDRFNPLLDDPLEFQAQYREKETRTEKLKLSTHSAFAGALRYHPGQQSPHQNSYSIRLALGIEKIAPQADLLPLKRPRYTGSQLITLFGVANTQFNQELAKDLAASISAAREENQVERALRRLLGAVLFHNHKLSWTREEANQVFQFACATVSRPPSNFRGSPTLFPFLEIRRIRSRRKTA